MLTDEGWFLIRDNGPARRVFRAKDTPYYELNRSSSLCIICMRHNRNWIVCTEPQRVAWDEEEEEPPEGYETPEAALIAWKFTC